MATLKEIKRYPDTNSVEATWVDGEIVVKCHSYDQYQMDMLATDLGADLAVNQYIIDEVLAHQVPHPPVVEPIPTSITMRQARLQLLADGVLDDVSTAVSVMGPAAQIEWEYASEIQRTNPLVPAMQTILAWDEARVDQFFTEANAL